MPPRPSSRTIGKSPSAFNSIRGGCVESESVGLLHISGAICSISSSQQFDVAAVQLEQRIQIAITTGPTQQLIGIRL
jgi:hypothetical protein